MISIWVALALIVFFSVISMLIGANFASSAYRKYIQGVKMAEKVMMKKTDSTFRVGE